MPSTKSLKTSGPVWRLHTVEEGETLSEIARHYRVTVPALELANHLEAHATVPAGFMLNVPTAPPTVHLLHYRVVRGDTLEGIADRFDVTVSELKRWNNIRGAKVPRGSRLRIYAGGAPDRFLAFEIKVGTIAGPMMPSSGRLGAAIRTTSPGRDGIW